MAGLMVLVAFSATVSAFAAAPAPTQQSAIQPEEQAQMVGTSSISGTVRRLLTQDPIFNATVYYGGIGVEEGRLELAWGQVKTDENGDYSITGLTGGIYGLFVHKKGYLFNGRLIHLEDDEQMENVDFNLIKLGK